MNKKSIAIVAGLLVASSFNVLSSGGKALAVGKRWQYEVPTFPYESGTSPSFSLPREHESRLGLDDVDTSQLSLAEFPQYKRCFL